jgi:hypothetical protein
LIEKGKVGRMTSHACSRHEDKEMYRLINIGEVRGNMREGEGKRDVGHREEETNKVGEEKGNEKVSCRTGR